MTIHVGKKQHRLVARCLFALSKGEPRPREKNHIEIYKYYPFKELKRISK